MIGRKQTSLVYLVPLVPAFGGAAFAQSQPPDPVKSAGELEEVVVYAQKRAEILQDVPISVLAYDDEAMSRAQINTLMDLPSVSPSLNFESRSMGMYLNFTMRGIGAFAPGAGVQPSVGLVVDGVSISRPVEFNIGMDDIASVQLINGPQGTLFGANNIGGLVYVTTERPTSAPEAYFETTFTTDDEKIARVMVSGPISDRVRGRAFVYMQDREGYIDNLYPGLPDVGGESAQGGRGKLEIDITDNAQLLLTAEYRNWESTERTQHLSVDDPSVPGILELLGNGDPKLGRKVVNDPKLINSDWSDQTDIENVGFAADFVWHASDVFTVRSISAYRDLDHDGTLDIDESPGTMADPKGMNVVSGERANRGIDPSKDGALNYMTISNAVEYFTQELRLDFQTSALEGNVGVYYTDTEEVVDWNFPLLIAGEFMLDNIQHINLNTESWAVFGDVTWHVTDAVDVFAGYRLAQEEVRNDFRIRSFFVDSTAYDIAGSNDVIFDPDLVVPVTSFDEKEKNSDLWSARAGVSWEVSDTANLYASVSRGYTGAGANTATTATAETAFIDPTTAVSYEVGAKTEWFDRKVRVNAAVFRTDLKDIQANFFNPATNESSIINAGDFRSQGLELGVSTLLAERLMLSADLTLLDTEHTEKGVYQPCYYGQTAAKGCVEIAEGAFAQDIYGQSGVNAPDLKYNVSGRYDIPLASLPFDANASMSYTWTDDRSFELIYDPVASYQRSYGTVDVAFGIADKKGRFEASVFGKNLTDENFVTFTQSDAGRNVRTRGVYGRGSFAYYGVKFKYNFGL